MNKIELAKVTPKPLLFLIGIYFAVAAIMFVFSGLGDLPFNRKLPLESTPVAVYILVVLLLPVSLFLIYCRRKVCVTKGRLTVKSVINTISIRTGQITKVALIGADETPAPLLRTNGTTMPGLKSGWFRTGRQKFFVDFVNRPNVWIQTEGDTADILLELAQPEAMLRMFADK